MEPVHGAQFAGPVHAETTMLRSGPCVRPLPSRSVSTLKLEPVQTPTTMLRSVAFTLPLLFILPAKQQTPTHGVHGTRASNSTLRRLRLEFQFVAVAIAFNHNQASAEVTHCQSTANAQFDPSQ